MTDATEFLALEKKFWTGDAAFYERNLDADCLVVFTQMAGVMTKKEVAGTIASGSRWGNLDLKVKGFLEPAPGIALLSYEASATREDGGVYSALVSSGYVLRDDGWKMMFHQQTPLDATETG